MPILTFLKSIRRGDPSITATNSDLIRKLDFEYYINKNFNIDTLVAKQLSSVLGDLAKAEDYNLKSDNFISGMILQRMLNDFGEIETQVKKYKTQIEYKFPDVAKDDQN